MEKRIIAALEIADREVRLLVGQFFNGRLNILKVETVEHDGYQDGRLIKGHRIVQAIEKAVDNASLNLDARIERVVVSVYGLEIIAKQERLSLSAVGRISEYDIRRAYQDALTSNAPDSKICVNAIFNRYFVNGVATQKLPINEKNENVTADVEILYAERDALFEIVRCVENAGLEVMDLVVSDVGFAKEAQLYEASRSYPVVAVACEMQSVQLSLFYKGHLTATMRLEYGFDIFIRKLMETYKLSRDVVERLLYYNVDVNNVSPSDDPIFVWSTKSNSHELSEQDLLTCVGSDIIKMLDDINDTCEPIRQFGDIHYVFSGVASKIEGLSETMHTISDANCTVYRSATFGVKDPRFTSLIGALYYYKDTEFYRGSSQSSADENLFIEKNIGNSSRNRSNESDNSVTKRLRTLFMD